MTLHAPPAQLSTTAAAEQATERLDGATADPVLDVGALLDHRTRSRLVPPRLARRGPHLALIDGEDTKLLALEERITHLGRGTSADVRVEEKRVSRDHAIIVRNGRRSRLLDNRSSNGTYLNGMRIVAANLADGDVITLGGVAMRFVEVP